MTLEAYLIERARAVGIQIVGGSPLEHGTFPDGISINGFHTECDVAAINARKSDRNRVKGFGTVLGPLLRGNDLPGIVVPQKEYPLPVGFPGRQPTTYFGLALICEALHLPTDVYGICGRASRHHYGDWEMWWMQHHMRSLTVHDPRPRW